MRFVLVALFLAAVVLTTDASAELPPCLCTREMAPVCGNNGVTYSNKCEFACSKSQLKGRAADDLKIARGGNCNGPEIPEFVKDLK